MAETTSSRVQERCRRLTRASKTRQDALSRDESDQTCRRRRREDRTGRAERARQAESNRSQIKVAAMDDGPCRIVWRGWCWPPLCPPVHSNLNYKRSLGDYPSTTSTRAACSKPVLKPSSRMIYPCPIHVCSCSCRPDLPGSLPPAA